LDAFITQLTEEVGRRGVAEAPQAVPAQERPGSAA
jgi:hypothetical protein